MPDTSPRLTLPYLLPSQAQKHVTYNEALQLLDSLVQLTVQSLDAVTPPALPTDGEIHALGDGATGAWAGQDSKLAVWNGNSWLFVAPQDGWRVWDIATGTLRVWSTDSWGLPPGQTQNLSGIGINTNSDATNRLAVSAPATLLSHEGAGHQLKINKATAGDTASLLFQSGWSGRAELGLAGNDDFSVKVSADGSSWATALSVAANSGNVGIGTATPDKRLSVEGDGEFTGNLTITGSVYAGNGRVSSFTGGDAGGLVTGSNFGTLIEGPSNGHLVLGIRENNPADSVTILSGGGNYDTDSTYDTVVASFLSNGNVGIGTSNPQRRLHLKDVLRISPSTTPASSAKGDIYFDSTTNKLRCHNGTSWKDLF